MNTKIGTLKHGLKIGDQVHKSFQIREATAGDLFAAEANVDSGRRIAFTAAMLCQQLVSIGEFTGPFTIEMLGKLKPSDLQIMQEARLSLDDEGEDGQPD